MLRRGWWVFDIEPLVETLLLGPEWTKGIQFDS